MGAPNELVATHKLDGVLLSQQKDTTGRTYYLDIITRQRYATSGRDVPSLQPFEQEGSAYDLNLEQFFVAASVEFNGVGMASRPSCQAWRGGDGINLQFNDGVSTRCYEIELPPFVRCKVKQIHLDGTIAEESADVPYDVAVEPSDLAKHEAEVAASQADHLAQVEAERAKITEENAARELAANPTEEPIVEQPQTEPEAETTENAQVTE